MPLFKYSAVPTLRRVMNSGNAQSVYLISTLDSQTISMHGAVT